MCVWGRGRIRKVLYYVVILFFYDFGGWSVDKIRFGLMWVWILGESLKYVVNYKVFRENM